MNRNWSAVALLVLLAVCLSPAASAANLTFSGSVTVIPTTVGQYYDEIQSSNLSWAVIGPIVPEPLVDAFGGGEFAWRVVWFAVFGVLIITMFGRQRNVLIPLMATWIFAFFMVERFTQEGVHMMYALMIAATMGLIVYIAVSRR